MEERKKTMLRISDDLYEKIKVIAEKEKRSVNSQMEIFLEKSAKEYEEKNNIAGKC